MNNPKFVNSELKTVASEELQAEIEEELNADQEESDMSDVIKSNECCDKDNQCKKT